MSAKEKIAAMMLGAGFVALASGIAMISVPAAFIVGGVIAMFAGLVLDRVATKG